MIRLCLFWPCARLIGLRRNKKIGLTVRTGGGTQARDGSGSTAVVGVVTPEHVIVANAGDSRAILVMVAADYKTGGGGGGKGNDKTGKSLESKKGAAETIAAALGLRLGSGGGGGGGGGDVPFFCARRGPKIK